MNTRLNQWDAIFIALLIVLLSVYFCFFWKLIPIGEDAALYAVYPKAMLQGAILHTDLPVASNSLFFYITQICYSLFGTSKNVFVGIYATGYALLVFLIYWVTRTFLTRFQGFLSAVLTAIYSVMPTILYGLGRNPIMWSLVFIFLATYLKLKHNKLFWFGFCLGIATIIRETFLIIPVWYILFELVHYIFSRKQSDFLNILKCAAGLFLACLITAVLLTSDHSWSAYFHDVFQSGVAFRYQDGIFSWRHVFDNALVFYPGMLFYYLNIVILGFLTYCMPIKNLFIRFIQCILVPSFLIELFIINHAISYSVIPMLTILPILAVYQLYQIKLFWRKTWYALVTFLTLASCLSTPFFIKNIVACYYNSRYLYISDSIMQALLLSSIKHIPAKTIATSFQLTYLFYSKVNASEYHDPYLFDLWGPHLLNRKSLGIDQINALQAEKIDLVLFIPGYFFDDQAIFQTLREHYVMLARFGIISVYISRSLLNNAYHMNPPQSVMLPSQARALRLANSHEANVVLRITSDLPRCMENILVNGGGNQFVYQPKIIQEDGIYTYVAKGQQIDFIRPDASLDCTYYVTNYAPKPFQPIVSIPNDLNYIDEEREGDVKSEYAAQFREYKGKYLTYVINQNQHPFLFPFNNKAITLQ